MIILGILLTALLFGGMILFSFGFAAFVFSALPPEVAGQTLRRAFPHFYLFVIATAAAAAVVLWQHDSLASSLLGFIALSTWPSRQYLMPAINAATDAGDKSRFKLLHGVSVTLTVIHIVLAGVVLARFN